MNYFLKFQSLFPYNFDMNKPTFRKSTAFDKLNDKEISSFRLLINDLTNNTQEIAYYCSNHEQNFSVENAQFSNIFKEAQSTISDMVDSKTISECRDIIDKFKPHFVTFSTYFTNIQNDLFENAKNLISNELFSQDEIKFTIKNNERDWRKIFNSTGKKNSSSTYANIDEVEFCYAVSMTYHTINQLTKFYNSLPKPVSIAEIIEENEKQKAKFEAAEREYKRKLEEKDKQLDTSLKERRELQIELDKTKKQNEVLSRQNTDLQSDIRNLQNRLAELEKNQASYLDQISNLQNQLKEALENPTPKHDQNDLNRIKERYLTVMQHVRDLTLVID